MKTLTVGFATMLVLTLSGCYSSDSAHRDDQRQTPGEAAGKAAYEVQKDAKKAAKELSKDLKSFGHDAHQGFQEQKQKDQERKPENPDAK